MILYSVHRISVFPDSVEPTIINIMIIHTQRSQRHESEITESGNDNKSSLQRTDRTPEIDRGPRRILQRRLIIHLINGIWQAGSRVKS